jgi:hypothetical protein
MEDEMGQPTTETPGKLLQRIAAERRVNPYYLAYAIETGVAGPKEAFDRDGGNHGFTIWNNQRWSEQAKAEGVGREWVSRSDDACDRHCEFLAARIADRLTQQLAA